MDVNKYELNTEKTIEGLVELSDEEIERYSVKPNDLFFTRTSETSDEIGLTSAYVGNPVKCVFSGFLLRARPKINLNSLFFAYYLRSPKQRNNIIKFSSITTRALISGGNLSKMKINIPPIEEQNKIANLFVILDKKVKLLEMKYQKYQDFKKYLMQQIFAQKLRFDFEGEWDEKYVKDIFDITRGDVIAKSLVKDVPDETYCYPVLSSQTTNNGVMGYFNDYDFDGEFITWTTDGANAGKTVYRDGKFKCSNVCGVLKAKSKYNGFANQFIAEYLDSITYRYVSYVGNPKLMNNIMAKIKIKFPPLEEQQKISKLFESVDLSIDMLQNKKENVEKFKKGLLQQMFV